MSNIDMPDEKSLEEMMEQGKALYEKAEQFDRELAQTMIIGRSEDDTARIKMTCNYQAKECRLHPKLLKGDVDVLQDNIVEAVQDAIGKIRKKTEEHIQQLAKLMNPGMGGMPPGMPGMPEMPSLEARPQFEEQEEELSV